MDGDRLTGTHRIDALVGLAFHTHLRSVAAECGGDVAANRLDVRRELRLLRNDDDIDVDDRVAGIAHDRCGAAQQIDAVRILPCRIAVGEVTADIASAGSTENSIGDSKVNCPFHIVPIQLKNLMPVGTAIRNVMKEKNGSRTPPVTYMWWAHTVTERPAMAMVAPIRPM